jgi:hypothetical protein
LSDVVNPDGAPEQPRGAAPGEEAVRRMRRKSRRSFLVGGLSALAGLAGWRWLATRPADGGIPWPLRRALEFNERLARSTFRGSRLAPTFSRSLAQEPRVNGTLGMSDRDFDPSSWRLRVEGLHEPLGLQRTTSAGPRHGPRPGNPDNGEGVLLLTLEDIKALPRVEMVTELDCIEGWSVVVQWAGARLVDFTATYPPATRTGRAPDVRRRPQDLVQYVALATPDGNYYVGLDMPSALHPQTLLCYEMNGAPLTLPHGAPLRLVLPVKYGIKHIKRIGTIRFTDTRPPDYWAERGYDWYAGL